MNLVRITAKDVVNFLNTLLSIDHNAMVKLYNSKIECNRELAEHPTVQVRADTPDGPYWVGLLGILNGLFGIEPTTQYGYISMNAELDTDSEIPEKVKKINSFQLTDFEVVKKKINKEKEKT